MEVIAGHLWMKVVVAAALKVVITVQEALLSCPYSLEWAEHSMTAISTHFRETNLDRRMSAALLLNSNYSLSKNRLLIEVHGALRAMLPLHHITVSETFSSCANVWRSRFTHLDDRAKLLNLGLRYRYSGLELIFYLHCIM